MNAQFRSEILKQRTTRTVVGMGAAMAGVAILAIALHAFGLNIKNVTDRKDQLGIFIDVGTHLGIVFGALVGVLAITTEIRHGTIRPTLLATPQRGRVVVAKTLLTSITGFVFGAVAVALASGAGTLFLNLRGVTIHVRAADYALLMLGGAFAAALWAVIGLGIGAIVRNQVPAVVSILVWILFVESLLDGGFPAVGKFAPAALALALAGSTDNTLHTPTLAGLVLAVYAGAAIYAGWFAFTRRDIA
jgi:ABC-type transport system involved in multi-copper enzyme maturation permease subunit